jgi:hypothetical protein
MAKKRETREQLVYKKLAACGKYHDTGKVLIGLQYQPPTRHLMGPDEEIVQRILLGQRFSIWPRVQSVYVIGLLLVLMFTSALEERFK